MKFILCENQQYCYKIQTKLLKKGYNWGFVEENIRDNILYFKTKEFPLYIIIPKKDDKNMYWGEINEIIKDRFFSKKLRKYKLKQINKNEQKSRTSTPNI